MVKHRHKKKRNVAIVYELLLREISAGIVEGREDRSAISRKILAKHFKPGTELYREFRLLNALARTNASSTDVADAIVREARLAACEIDSIKLEKERTSLLEDVNRKLGREQFYRRFLENYRSYATIQTLMDDWRRPTGENIARRAEYEKKVKDWLLAEKKEVTLEDHQPNGALHQPDVDNLVLKLMEEKINSTFSSSLTTEQKRIVSAYAFLDGADDERSLAEVLQTIKTETLQKLDKFSADNTDKFLAEKADVVRRDVLSLPVQSINDEMIVRYMTVCQLSAALSEGER